MNLDRLLEIQKKFFSYSEPQALFEAILAFLPQLGADFGAILLQSEDQIIYFRSTMPGQEDLIGPAGQRFARKLITQGLEGHIMRSGQSEVVDNVLTDERWYRAAYVIDVCRGVAILPLYLTKAHLKGVLVLGSDQTGAFSPSDLPTLEMVASQIGYAIENTLLYRHQLERSTQLNLINEVSRAATSILNVNLMLTTVTQAIQRSFGIHRVGIYRLMPTEQELKLGAITGADGRLLSPEEISPHTDPFITWVIEHGKTAVANDIKVDHRYEPTPQYQAIKSKLVIPIKLGVKIIGVLNLESTNLDAFDPPLVAAMETLSDQLAVAIENARLYDELNYTVNELLALNRITLSVSATLDFQETLTLITQHVISILNVAATSVALRDDKTGEIWFAAASGEGSTAVLGKRMQLGQGIIGWVAQYGEPLIIHNVHQEPRFFAEMDKQSGFKTESILCVPLQTKGRLIGAIEAMNKMDGQFTAEDLSRLTALTAPAATAIENAQLYQELAQRMAQVEALRAFNQNIIENITTGLIALDSNGVITVFNKAASAMLGLNPEDMIGQSVKETMSHIPQLINLLTPPLANQQPLIHRDMIIKHWDGSQITVTATATPMYDADNHLSGVVGLIEDVTELKTLEAERRRLDRLAYLGEMSAVVAHELRNPIAGIAAGTNYLIRKFPSDSPNYEAGQMILKEVDRVQRITEDILLIARPLNLQKAPHSLKDIIAAVCKKYQSALPEKGIELNITLAETLPELSIDRAKIEQVISNLMENAIQAMPDGGTISITADHVPADSKIIILFKDTGSGISIAGTQKIFEPFFTTKSRGTGLGLTLSRRILEAHQGAINIVTIDESGTTFEIGLPIQ